VSLVLTAIALLIPAFSLLFAPPVLSLWLPREQNAPLPSPLLTIHRFGLLL